MLNFFVEQNPALHFFNSTYRSPQHGSFRGENISWPSLSSHRRNCAQSPLLSRLDKNCSFSLTQNVLFNDSSVSSTLTGCTQEKCRRRSNEKVNCRSCKIGEGILILHQIYINNHLDLLHFLKNLKNAILYSRNPFLLKAGTSLNNASCRVFIKKTQYSISNYSRLSLTRILNEAKLLLR